MAQTFKIVDVPAQTGGRVAGPNPFEAAAKAAVEAQEKGKAIAFPLDTDGFVAKGDKTVADMAAQYVTRKVREMGIPLDRTFTVVVADGIVTVSAKARITRAKKTD